MKKHPFRLLLALVALTALLGGCSGGVSDGTYTENGLRFEVRNHAATVIGCEEGTEQASTPAQFRGLNVQGIAEGAFRDNPDLKELSFSGQPESFLIGSEAFRGSEIQTIANLPANATFAQDALAGLSALKSVTVSGTGPLCVEDGALIHTDDDGTRTLRLLPAAAVPQKNFSDGTYTVTGVDVVAPHAAESCSAITRVLLAADVSRIQKDAFAHLCLECVTIAGETPGALMIEENAFPVHKDLRILVPATDDTTMKSWLTLSKNYVYGHNLLVHPAACTREDMHCHGMRTTLASGSFEGYPAQLLPETQSIRIEARYTITQEAADLFAEFAG